MVAHRDEIGVERCRLARHRGAFQRKAGGQALGRFAGCTRGGLIAQFSGYIPVFVLSIAFQILALGVLIGVVKEPRNRRLTLQGG